MTATIADAAFASDPLSVPLHDPEFSTGDPFPAYARLRREAPVYWCEGGFWALSKYDDVMAVSRQPELFCSGKGILIDDLRRDVPGNESVIYLDPPEHARHRKFVSGWFRPRTVAAFEERVRALAVELLDRVPPNEEVDFLEAIAVPFPLLVISEMLGLPAEDYQQFREWSDLLISSGSEQIDGDTTMGMLGLFEYFGQLLERRRAAPGHDLISDIATAEIDGERLSDFDIKAFCMTLLVAGNETTRNLVANSALAFADHPDQLDLLRRDPAAMPVATEELLRWISPVMHFSRTATRDTELRGQAIAEGDMVVMFYGAANRDEDVFGLRAEQLDVQRDPNPQVAFGFGEHFCLGARLARLETTVLFEELMRRFDGIEVAGPVVRRRSNLMRGFDRLPLRFRPS